MKMKKHLLEEPVAQGEKPDGISEIDYTPKTYSLREQIVYGLKLVGIIGTVLVAFWLYEIYVVK
jgi:hypothetical protein